LAINHAIIMKEKSIFKKVLQLSIMLMISFTYSQNNIKDTLITTRIKIKFGELIVTKSISQDWKSSQIRSSIWLADDCLVENETVYVNFTIDSNCLISNYKIDTKGKSKCAIVGVEDFCKELMTVIKQKNEINFFDKCNTQYRLPFFIKTLE
jgi:hypothetical protein